MNVRSDWPTHDPLAADSTPFACRAAAGLEGPNVSVAIVPVPPGIPTPPDGSTHIVHTRAPAGQAVNFELHLHPDVPQTDILGPGRVVEWDVLLPQSTLDAIKSQGQIKLMLNRVGGGVNHFVVLGVGNLFNSNVNAIQANADQNNVILGQGPPITPDVWHHVKVEQWRTPGIGHAVVTWDGAVIATGQGPELGDDDPKSLRGVSISSYTERAALGGTIDIYTGNIHITERGAVPVPSPVPVPPPVPAPRPPVPPVHPPIGAGNGLLLLNALRTIPGVKLGAQPGMITVTFKNGQVFEVIAK